LAKTVEEFLERAAACRAAAESEILDNVRRLHLEAAAKWEMFADQARRIASTCEEPPSSQFGISRSQVALRSAFDWPSNDRPLHVEPIRIAEPCDCRARTAEDFPKRSAAHDARPAIAEAATESDSSSVTLYAADGSLRTLEEIEGDVIRLAVGLYRGRLTEVARRLGIGRSTLYRKLGELGIDHAGRSSEQSTLARRA
jgi:DNA-binding NtrC family response regulator